MDDRTSAVGAVGFPSFHDAVGFIFSSYVKAKPHRKSGYDRDNRDPAHTRQLLDALGTPDKLQRNIKITGSKGKGSTARLLAGVLASQGKRVGLFTSPHLIDFTERIRVNGKAISEPDFLRLLTRAKPVIDAFQDQFAPGQYFGPVGLTAVLAMLYFLEQGTDVNVIELGRGARHDDVNAIVGEVAAITPVQNEHADYLGPTLADIAFAKAGIATPGTRAVVFGRQTSAVERILTAEAKAMGAAPIVFGRDFAVLAAEPDGTGSRFSVAGQFSRYENLRIGLLGSHQADNAAVAIAAAEVFLGRELDVDALSERLPDLRLPGRAQVIDNTPKVVIDGAINRESAACAKEVVGLLHPRAVVAIVAVPNDKDVEGLAAVLSEFAHTLIVTRAQNPYLHYADENAIRAAAHPSVDVRGSSSLENAMSVARQLSELGDLIAIVGTQSLVADALVYFDIPTRDLC